VGREARREPGEGQRRRRCSTWNLHADLSFCPGLVDTSGVNARVDQLARVAGYTGEANPIAVGAAVWASFCTKYWIWRG